MVLSSALEVSPSDPMTERVPFQTVASVAKVLLAFSIFVMSGSAAVACNIPVFRYALERWQPDNCELILFHREPLNPIRWQRERDALPPLHPASDKIQSQWDRQCRNA